METDAVGEHSLERTLEEQRWTLRHEQESANTIRQCSKPKHDVVESWVPWIETSRVQGIVHGRILHPGPPVRAHLNHFGQTNVALFGLLALGASHVRVVANQELAQVMTTPFAETVCVVRRGAVRDGLCGAGIRVAEAMSLWIG